MAYFNFDSDQYSYMMLDISARAALDINSPPIRFLIFGGYSPMGILCNSFLMDNYAEGGARLLISNSFYIEGPYIFGIQQGPAFSNHFK